MKSLIMVLCLTVSSVAYAGGNHTCQGGHNCNSTGTGGGSVSGTQHQGQGQAQGQAQDSTALSSSAAISSSDTHASNYASNSAQGGNSHQSQNSASTSKASNQGNNSSYNNDTKALGLELGSVTAAPADTSACRIDQTAGWRVTLVERTGRNKLDRKCVEQTVAFARCMDIARAYLTAQMMDSYAKQLASCGGVGATEVTVTSTSKVQYVTREELDRAFQATQRK